MTLINSSLLLGLVLSAVPVLLHLIMRAKPKVIEFPALRLLQVRRPANARRMRVRQLLLLALRMLVIAALVLAFARPSLPAANYSLRWWEWAGLGCAVSGAMAAWHWLQRRSGLASGSVQGQRDRGMRRVYCLLGGMAAALLFTALPWAVRVRQELLSPGAEGAEDVPVAAVFVFDNSFSMTYLTQNRTRLEQAQDLARQQLERFPGRSVAAVASLDSADEFVFQADLSGASAKLEGISPSPLPRKLNPQLRAAVRAHQEHRSLVQQEAGTGPAGDLYSREIYVFSDFTSAAFQLPDESGLADLLKQHDWLHVYLVDLAVPGALNAGISELSLADDSITPGLKLDLSLTVRSQGTVPATAIIETSLINAAGQETRTGAPAVVSLEGGDAKVLTSIDVPAGLESLQGIVRINSEDPLGADNVRWFSCGILPTPKVLLISDRLDETLYLRNALQPEERERAGIRTCDCRRITTAEAGEQTFGDFDAVIVSGLQRPDEPLWAALGKYVASGGSVLAVAGSGRIQAPAWNSPAATRLLPATPITPVKFLDSTSSLLVADSGHPVTRTFAADETLRVGLGTAAFERCWAVEPATDSSLLLSFTGPNLRPALLERRVGQGRCLMFTSAMDNLTDGGSKWNNFAAEWSFVALLEKLMLHMAGGSEFRRNFLAGELIELPLPADQRFQQYLMQRPGLAQTRGAIEPAAKTLLIDDARELGHYSVRPFESAANFSAAFAVNLPGAETDLTRIPPEQLQAVFDSDRAAVIRSPEELQQVVRTGRIGVEVFPVLLGLLLLLLSAEHLMANHFYDEPPGEATGSGKH
ncbi:MAG: BatA domain-containing protein [Planctomycetota bacterium]